MLLFLRMAFNIMQCNIKIYLKGCFRMQIKSARLRGAREYHIIAHTLKQRIGNAHQTNCPDKRRSIEIVVHISWLMKRKKNTERSLWPSGEILFVTSRPRVIFKCGDPPKLIVSFSETQRQHS